MTESGTEVSLVEMPIVGYLQELGYEFLGSGDPLNCRGSARETIFHGQLVKALQRLNGIPYKDATAVVDELSKCKDNEEWINVMRGAFSRQLSNGRNRRTIKLIDYKTPFNNQFGVARQLRVVSSVSGTPDLVVYVNGLPVVVIEAKTPVSEKEKLTEAIEQIRRYERDIPRLFYTNVFNVVTDGVNLLYGASRATPKFFMEWRDVSHSDTDVRSNPLRQSLSALLEPKRLLDIIAHFVVFERTFESEGIVKKVARFQQIRAVNKMVDRVVDKKKKRGLIWHTQGSGKSLTMVFAALKLKKHLTVDSPKLTNPNILVLTDRVDLNNQIMSTFMATQLPNPEQATSIEDLQGRIRSKKKGQTLMSTIFLFRGSTEPIPNSEDWIVMVDECHRTQERGLGTSLRATLPKAIFFGFTGTPIRNDDKNTYQNFGAKGERYLDKYGIDDAVRDNATVPVFYTCRKGDWSLEPEKLDCLFEKALPRDNDEELGKILHKGVKIADLVHNPTRVGLIAQDIWTHFKQYAKPDGFKAQLVAYDREGIVLYKKAFDKLIAEEYQSEGLHAEVAREKAQKVTACVYSSSRDDENISESEYTNFIRSQLRRWYLNEVEEQNAKQKFKVRGENPQLLIVCDKLLTGFDAPVASVIYLDKPLKEHNLLQAIARTNRVVDSTKKHGLVVDYIGVSNYLDEALASYNSEDIANAMRDVDELLKELESTHNSLKVYAKGISRKGKDIKTEYDHLVGTIGTIDEWILFSSKVRKFVALYEAIEPDPSVIGMRDDLKWFGNFLLYGRLIFEARESLDRNEYSAKIREILDRNVKFTGLSTFIELRSTIDKEFWSDYENVGPDNQSLRSSALKKTAELRKITSAKLAENPYQYKKFSDKIKDLISKMDDDLLTFAEKLEATKDYAKEIEMEERAYTSSGLTKEAYSVRMVIEMICGTELNDMTKTDIAKRVEQIYLDERIAPKSWHTKHEVRKKLRSEVRKLANRSGVRSSKLSQLPNAIEEVALSQFARNEND